MTVDQKEFVIVDVETTGLSPEQGDRVVEIAAIKMIGTETIGKFETLINPQRPIPFGAYQVHGITEDMVSGAPRAQEVFGGFLEFVSGACLVGHNVKFDLRFINNELFLSGFFGLQNIEVMDTIKMARGLVPHLGSYSLGAVVDYFNAREGQQHRAMADVIMTQRIFVELLAAARKRNIDCFPVLHNLFGIHKVSKPTKKEKMQRISDAIASRHTLKILYCGVQNGITFRKVTPVEIQKDGRQATLVGQCHLRKEDRNFTIDRIVQLDFEEQ